MKSLETQQTLLTATIQQQHSVFALLLLIWTSVHSQSPGCYNPLLPLLKVEEFAPVVEVEVFIVLHSVACAVVHFIYACICV